MLHEFYLCNRWITGDDRQEATLHLDLKYLQGAAFIWHGAARNEGGSSEPTFLVDVNKA